MHKRRQQPSWSEKPIYYGFISNTSSEMLQVYKNGSICPRSKQAMGISWSNWTKSHVDTYDIDYTLEHDFTAIA